MSPTRIKQEPDSDASPPRKAAKSDSDASPPRRLPNVKQVTISKNHIGTQYCTEVRFASFLSGGFITAIAVNTLTGKETGKTRLCVLHGLDLPFFHQVDLLYLL